MNASKERSRKGSRIERAVSVCKKVVSSFSFGWKRRRDLATAQKELNIHAQQLISESPTRWGSRQKMIEPVLEQDRAESHYCGTDATPGSMFNFAVKLSRATEIKTYIQNTGLVT
ncbi:hypothetical protein COCON_G00233380 [Conger conger]|uniref:Uncharacterized protein n=1 Tax=Conger conger TaxID=82655 RepID=A0A9Q1CWA5_CONCO|nr:hypothetical protein COCON_G00233380 [Conger conger]